MEDEEQEQVSWADFALGAAGRARGHEYIAGIQYAVPLKSPIFQTSFDEADSKAHRGHVESLAVQLNLMTYETGKGAICSSLWSGNEQRNENGEWKRDWSYTLRPDDPKGNEADYLVRHRFLVEVTEELCNEASSYSGIEIDTSLVGGYTFMDPEQMRWVNARPTIWPDEGEVQEAVSHCLLTNGLTGANSIFPKGADLILYGSSMQMNMFIAARDSSYVNDNPATRWKIVQPKRAYSQRHYSTVSNPPRGMLFDNQELS